MSELRMRAIFSFGFWMIRVEIDFTVKVIRGENVFKILSVHSGILVDRVVVH